MTRWVLLRGLTREAGHWGAFADLLARRSGGRVVPLDLPGNGRRWGERSPADVRAMAADCRAALPPVAGPTVLLAMSLGGMVAVEWCRAAAPDIAGCVLINTSAGGGSPPWQRLRPASWPILLGALLPGRDVQAREQAVLRMTSGNPRLHPSAPAQWAAIARRHPVRAGNAVRQLWAAARYRAAPQAPSVPVLLLASEADRLVHVDCSRRLAAQWQAPLRLHPWAGHDLALDDPAWVAQEALSWWTRVRGRT
ncbi:MAG TPA: alpha/beta hydrolase [Ramlibacter sp.]|jgi:pimeloyl-ACP methyl ester carboxylesterase|uniref:alpha/beta fold hydrolase n=1 Tax=Ramlibacter sp. TaxID=1917967 RepID=UPI002D5B4275|nr:alpha/beta hydrolase [Ramlibacter sp.]HZY18214.1 alpha/beta hydrolase [Ramlibacter sp.]